MRITRKPIRKCHGCRLNSGDRCWGYEYPQRQWRHNRRCPAYDNPTAYALYDTWRSQPDVKTPRQLRQAAYPQSKPRRHYHLEDWDPETTTSG